MKVETEKGHEIVSRLIVEKIKDGEWKPGDKLPSVVDLSALFGVGRSTLREALSALKATGWLDIRHGGGTFVRNELPTDATPGASDLLRHAESIQEILEVRTILENGTAALAAERHTSEQAERLRAIISRMETALARNDTSASERADVDFHTAIAAATGNALLVRLMDALTGKLNDTIGHTRALWFYEEKASAERLLEEHRAIYEAIAARDADAASGLIGAHLSKVEKVLREKSGAANPQHRRNRA